MTRVIVVLLALIAAVTLATSVAGEQPDASTATPTTIVDNPFLPEDENLSDCISALPRPGCGSEARGGWRQILVLALVVAGVAFIAWRVVRSVRRREAPAGRASASYGQPAQHGDGVRGRSPREGKSP